MISFSLVQMASVLKAKHIGTNSIIHTVSINSNVIDIQCMFVALVGKRFDGHDFAAQAVVSGAKALLVNYYISSIDIPQLIVSDTHDALMELGYWIRRQTLTKIIAITGSSGKTSVKEMAVTILQECGQVIATQENFNNTIGVPITLLQLTKKSNFAVIEVGANCLGEMKKLSQMVSADVALVNNIFPSHISGFGSLVALGQEKGKIFSEMNFFGTGIINSDSHALYLWRKALYKKAIWRFSLCMRIGIDFFASNIVVHINGTQFILHSPYGVASIFLPMLGIHNISNALAASALAFSVGATLSEVVRGLKKIKAIPRRLFPIVLSPGKLLLDDTYNSNIGSMIAAIRVLNIMPGYRVLIVSDMSELGELHEIKYHSYIGKIISKTNIDRIFTIGDVSYFISKMSGRGEHFQDKIKLMNRLKVMLYRYNLISILVKGSRIFRMEQIVDYIRNSLKCPLNY